MSALITIHCDQAVDEHSICGLRIYVATSDIDRARRKAINDGWLVTAQRDLCPKHSGSGPILPPVTRLEPKVGRVTPLRP